MYHETVIPEEMSSFSCFQKVSLHVNARNMKFQEAVPWGNIVSRNGLLLCVQFVFTTLNNSLLFLVPVRQLSRELRVINYNLRKIVGMTNLPFRGEGYGSCALKLYDHRSTHGRQKRFIVRLFHAPAN